MPCWFNGTYFPGDTVTLAINEPALLYGATVFTTLRVYASLDHPLTAWAAHRDRLIQALRRFAWPAPDWPQVRQGLNHLAQDYPVLRITCFPDGRELVTGRSLPPDLAAMQTQGIVAWVAQGEIYERSQPQYKTGSYLGAWLALQAAQGQGAREAILIDAQGHWLETSTGNLWGWADGRWHTPSLGAGLLPGIVRQQLLAHQAQRGQAVVETLWTGERIQSFAALAYSNSVVQVVPIHTVLGDRSRLEFNPQHPALGTLRELFHSSSLESGPLT